MKQVEKKEVWRMNAFTDQPFKGNPAAVVLDADGLSDEYMQALAPELNNISETVFICNPDNATADIRLRYFTSTTEVDLCGHATIAALFTLAGSGRITGDNGAKTIHAETRVGVLKLGLLFKDGQLDRATMTQLKPVFAQPGAPEQIAEILGITTDGIRQDLAIVCGNTGIWSCYVPLQDLDTLASLKVRNELIEMLSPENEELAGIYPFVISDDSKAPEQLTSRGRFFSPPKIGIVEDPVTGTASGALGGYLMDQGVLDKKGVLHAWQGVEMGRAGLVRVEQGADGAMCISGRATAIYRGKLLA